jgi:hypothetical protein
MDVKRVKLEHTPAGSVDVTKMGALLSSIKDMLTLNENDEVWIRQMVGMPERSPEQLKEERETRKAETQEEEQEDTE